MVNYKEKRSSPRQPVLINFRYQIRQEGVPSGEFLEAQTNNLSASGLSFDSTKKISLETKLSIELSVPDQVEPILIEGRVVRLEQLLDKRMYNIGVAFSEISDPDKQAIVRNLENLNLNDLLIEVIKQGASDLHLTVGRSPVIRVQGKLMFIARGPIKNREIEAMVFPLLRELQIANLLKDRELDFAFSPELNSRFRVNLHWQRGFLEAAFRAIPTKIKSFEELGLPLAARDFAFSRRGLILVAGPTNSGKTTTLASMVETINQKKEAIIICIEDPIEYVHQSKKAIIKQRELGVDTLSYAEALRHSLRQDPDVIVVGEIVGVECVLAALQAAETGHLVITSIHAANASQAIERIIHMFPIEHKEEICIRLAACLEGVISQLLLSSADANSLVLASEVLVITTAIQHIIRENKLFQIPSAMQTGIHLKMQTFERSLDELFSKGLISGETLTATLQDIASQRREGK